MPARRKKAKTKKNDTTGATVGYEAQLWQMADALRGSMDAAEYKHVVLGLIFLKYISDAFEERHASLARAVDDPKDDYYLRPETPNRADAIASLLEDPDEYCALSIFWVPPESRWPHIKAQARQATIGQLVDDAMAGIERDNPVLKGVLPKDYARPALDKTRLGQLIDMISNIQVGDEEARAKDVLGRIYEYFLSQFASAEGKKGGEFYTPRFWSLPIMGGEGAHPLGEACDFARFCSGLDFWSINDHAEASSPRRWQETKEAIRQCNEVGGEGADPDVIAFLGWEWTQIGATAESHWGHKNVVLKETADDLVPTRPIHSGGVTRRLMAENPAWLRLLPVLADFENRQEYYDFDTYVREITEPPSCESGVDVRELPADCSEGAETPGELFEKLAQWGVESVVIPHGTTWGIYTPADSSWDKQLSSTQHDPLRQTLIEVFSGHGNSEEYRSFRPVTSTDGKLGCPAPSPGYVPSCWRAGELIRERCGETGLDAAECERRAVAARQHYVDAGQQGRLAVPGETASDWLDSGQCRDCFQPAFNYRPKGAAQYIAALRNFGETAGPERFRFGFIASSDVHTGRPGTGYKEFARTSMADQSGPRDQGIYDALFPTAERIPESQPVDFGDPSGVNVMRSSEIERQNSFWLTGGLVAVHAESRTRDGVWDALQRKETYGTSGERMLLWFDLLNAPGTDRRVSMGGELEMNTTPLFEVRAVGAFVQKPGCPEHSTSALAPEKVERLCRGECYHPSDQRRKIDRIEIVRIRPQVNPNEPMEALIDDPWRSFECSDDGTGCTAAFADPEFASLGRDVVYYARAIQETTLAVNAANLRCEYDDAGECVGMRPCWGDFRTPESDECLDETQERAWSSPIYVDWPRATLAHAR